MSKTHNSLSSAGELGEDRGSEESSVTTVGDTESIVIGVCAPFAEEGCVIPQFFEGGVTTR